MPADSNVISTVNGDVDGDNDGGNLNDGDNNGGNDGDVDDDDPLRQLTKQHYCFSSRGSFETRRELEGV